jgi:hypothetical protein
MVSRKHRTEGLSSPPEAGSEAQPNRATNDNTETVPVVTRTGARKGRLFRVGFLVAAVVAMIGWLIALGWVAIKLADRLNQFGS